MADEMGIFEVMYNCRAMRRLDTKPVPEELLRKLIDAANQAPSGSNAQNARWIVVRDPAIKQKLADLNREGVEGYITPQMGEDGAFGGDGKMARLAKAVLWQMEHMHELPALIVACMEYGREVPDDQAQRGGGSLWPGVQNLLLAARALQLGAAPTTLALRDQSAVREILNMPATMAALALIPVGYPLGKFGPVTRKPIDEIMRFDQWN